MKRSMELILAATVVLLFGFATSTPAQTVRRANVTPVVPPISVTPPTATNNGTGFGRVLTPASSIAEPGSAGVSFHTNVEVFMPEGFNPATVSPPSLAYGYNTPASVGCHYYIATHVTGCDPNTLTSSSNPSGGSGTIAIVDAYDDPFIAGDLAYFSAQFGLPFSTSQFQVVYATGAEPTEDSTGGWELEESLDVEYAHAMAPSANIILVEASSNASSALLTAVNVASCLVQGGTWNTSTLTCSGTTGAKGEVSMSWGGAEYSTESSADSNFIGTGVVYFAAAGDSPGVSYPCASPSVVCVGGTTWSRNPVTFLSVGDGAWQYGGGGQSIYETPMPSYQNTGAGSITSILSGLSSLGFNTSYRAVPDVSLIANPYSGVWVYDSFTFTLPPCPSVGCNAEGGWVILGGTSAATPMIAGIVNNASTVHSSFATGSQAELTKIYSNSPAAVGDDVSFNDVLSGFGACGPYMAYQAATGWDPCTGLGTPYGLSGL